MTSPYIEDAFIGIQSNFVVYTSFENHTEVLGVVHSLARMAGKIIQENFHNRLKIVKGIGHGSLICSSDVFKAEGNFSVCESTTRKNKCSLMLILRFDLNLVITEKSVDEGKNLTPDASIQDLIYEWCGEVVFQTCTIQVSKISAHADRSLLLIHRNGI